MISKMFGHQPKPRKFNYPNRYYDPKEEERKKRRIKFERPHKKHHQGRSIVLYALCLAFVVFLIYLLGGGQMSDIYTLFQ